MLCGIKADESWIEFLANTTLQLITPPSLQDILYRTGQLIYLQIILRRHATAIILVRSAQK